jgi:hypothetical protein
MGKVEPGVPVSSFQAIPNTIVMTLGTGCASSKLTVSSIDASLCDEGSTNCFRNNLEFDSLFKWVGTPYSWKKSIQ